MEAFAGLNVTCAVRLVTATVKNSWIGMYEDFSGEKLAVQFFDCVNTWLHATKLLSRVNKFIVVSRPNDFFDAI